MNGDALSTDLDDFHSFRKLQHQAAALSQRDFLDTHPQLALLVGTRDTENDEGGDLTSPADSGVQLLTLSIKSAEILRYLGKVAFVRKRPGNPFAHLISVGRSAKNDIRIGVQSLSKVHGYFVDDRGTWCFADHKSTNGSRRNGLPLRAGKQYPLEDGDRLQLGLEVVLEILFPESLYQRLRAQAR